MLTKGNEFFYSVGGLMVPKKEVDDKIIDYIEFFIDHAPILNEQAKEYLSEAKAIAFITTMKTISSVLYEIHAKYLAVEADKIIKLAEAENLVVCKKMLTSFITDFLSLSIDLQIAQKKSGVRGRQNTIEVYTDILNNLKAADTLVSDMECDKAINILSHISLLKENKNIKSLIKLLKTKDFKNASIAIKALKNEYTELLTNLGVTLLDENNTKKKILAVDDYSGILITIRDMLDPHFNVYAAAGAKTALAIMEKHKPDLFLLDIEMPEISGFELAKTIRASNEHKDTPIIFLTSNATREHVMKALKCGANDFIVKPATYNSLMVKISKLIEIETD